MVMKKYVYLKKMKKVKNIYQKIGEHNFILKDYKRNNYNKD